MKKKKKISKYIFRTNPEIGKFFFTSAQMTPIISVHVLHVGFHCRYVIPKFSFKGVLTGVLQNINP